MSELKHIILGNHPDSNRYTLTRIFRNGEKRLWQTFVTRKSAINTALTEAKKFKVPIYNELLGKHRRKLLQ